MLYGMLLHQDTPMRDEKSVPPKLPPHTTAVAQTTSQLLYRVVSRAFVRAFHILHESCLTTCIPKLPQLNPLIFHLR